MDSFAPHVYELISLVLRLGSGFDYPNKKQILTRSLNGACYEILKREVSLEERRRDGAFFTSQKLALKLYKQLTNTSNAIFLDPTCGIGDLLLPCANSLPIENTLERTLDNWADHLVGFDINPQFVLATKARIVLSAIARGAYSTSKITDEYIGKSLPNIRVQNVFESVLNCTKATHIVLNPPFNYQATPNGVKWTSGKVSSAAVILEKLIKELMPGVQISAILPDVLRSGARYSGWRDAIAKSSAAIKMSVVGQFDPSTDVDVFILNITVGEGLVRKSRFWVGDVSKKQVSNYFDVHVGRVVPHRDPLSGKLYPYLDVSSAPAWKEINNISTSLMSPRVPYRPPFVLVRRTSSPSDSIRAIGTIVKYDEQVAVENHLLVLLPHDGRVKTCRKLLKLLKSQQTQQWLNRRIRCRHLTVSAIKEIPWLEL